MGAAAKTVVTTDNMGHSTSKATEVGGLIPRGGRQSDERLNSPTPAPIADKQLSQACVKTEGRTFMGEFYTAIIGLIHKKVPSRFSRKSSESNLSTSSFSLEVLGSCICDKICTQKGSTHIDWRSCGDSQPTIQAYGNGKWRIEANKRMVDLSG